MVRVGKNGGVSDVPPRGDGNNTQQASQSKNKPNCVFEVKGEGSFVTLKNGNLEEFIDFAQNERTIRVYDESGQLRKETVIEQKFPMKPSKISTKEYDEKGNRIKSGYDNNADGKLDEIHEYDENDNFIKSSYDNNADGKLDLIVEHEYYENGNRIKSSYDNNADGKIDFIFEDEYYENGKRIKESYDRNADGKPDEITEYEYDENGNLIKSSCDDNADGKPDEIREYEYDENGNKIETRRYDVNADGKLDL